MAFGENPTPVDNTETNKSNKETNSLLNRDILKPKSILNVKVLPKKDPLIIYDAGF